MKDSRRNIYTIDNCIMVVYTLKDKNEFVNRLETVLLDVFRSYEIELAVLSHQRNNLSNFHMDTDKMEKIAYWLDRALATTDRNNEIQMYVKYIKELSIKSVYCRSVEKEERGGEQLGCLGG